MSFDAISDLIKNLGDVSPEGFCFLILLGLNLILRRIPMIKNWWIPIISCVVGMPLFAAFLPLATHFINPLARNIGMGFLVGLVAAVGYSAIVAFAEKKWPWLHGVLNPEEVKPTVIAPPTDETTQDK